MKQLAISGSPDDLKEVANQLLNIYPDARIFAFFGKMGAGKTTFIKAFCRVLGVTDVVNSPTFALINQYFTENGNSVYHFDFYRIQKPEEVMDIGYEDYFYSGDYCLIEWPEKIKELLPTSAIVVQIVEDEKTGERIFSYT